MFRLRDVRWVVEMQGLSKGELRIILHCLVFCVWFKHVLFPLHFVFVVFKSNWSSPCG